MSTTLRVSDETRERVALLATATGRQMQMIVDEVVAAYEQSLFWAEFEKGCDQLAGNPAAWREILAEREGKSPALADGIE